MTDDRDSREHVDVVPLDEIEFWDVARRDDRRRRVLVGLCVLLLAVGFASGYVAGQPHNEAPAVSSAISSGELGEELSGASASDGLLGVAGPLTRVLGRAPSGVEVRVYSSPATLPHPRGCEVHGSIVAELWNDRAVGVVDAAQVVGPSAMEVSAGAFGAVEGSPVGVVIVQLPPELDGVATVQADFGLGVDEMAPVDGIAVLAMPLSPSSPVVFIARVAALGDDGTVVAQGTAGFGGGSAVPYGPPCELVPVAPSVPTSPPAPPSTVVPTTLPPPTATFPSPTTLSSPVTSSLGTGDQGDEAES